MGRRASRAAALVLLSVCARHGVGAQALPPALVTVEMVELAADRIMAEQLYPPREPADTSPSADVQLLLSAEQSPIANVRRVFLRALGRFESAGDVERIVSHLADTDASVRRQAAEALGQALASTQPGEAPKAVKLAFDTLQIRLVQENVPAVTSAVLAALGDLPYDAELAARAERMLEENTHPFFTGPGPGRAVEALQALRSFIGHRPDRPVSQTTRRRLRDLSRRRLSPGDLPSPLLPALEALQILHDADPQTILAAAACYGPPCTPEIRRVGVQMIEPTTGIFADALRRALNDADIHLRIAALQTVARAIPHTHDCGPLVAAITDRVVIVGLTAIDLLAPDCDLKGDVSARLELLARELSQTSSVSAWHRPARALVALALFDASAAGTIATRAASHNVWQVRAAAAKVAGTMGDEKLAIQLVGDRHPNVRAEALTSLGKLKSEAIESAAASALKSEDYQLVMTAAAVLKGRARSEGVAPALVQTLLRITGPDTSREARLEIWARLAELPAPQLELASTLGSFAEDYDPMVAAAAAQVLTVWTGNPVRPNPTHRPVDQPTAVELTVPWANALMILDNGDRLLLEFDRDDAPVAVARFARLAMDHYFDGQEFYRMAGDMQVFVGSPAPNDYIGDARFVRDEIGGRHERSAVGLAARGRHTGDMRFFIDVMGIPALNRSATVFAHVTAGRQPACQTSPMFLIESGRYPIEGVKIQTIELRRADGPFSSTGCS